MNHVSNRTLRLQALSHYFIFFFSSRTGVDYIEVQNPAAGDGAVEDIKSLLKMGLRKSKVLAHIRCHMLDAKKAVESGVHGKRRRFVFFCRL